jgi:hypothetical protein
MPTGRTPLLFNRSLYVNGKSARKPNGKTVHSEKVEHHNRVPDSVLHDGRLSFAARCVYGVLAGSVFQGTVATIGQRLIAKKLHCHQETVSAALRDLEQFGHIVIIRNGKQRHWYHLTSNLFGQKQRAGVEEVQSYGPASAPQKRLVSVRTA